MKRSVMFIASLCIFLIGGLLYLQRSGTTIGRIAAVNGEKEAKQSSFSHKGDKLVYSPMGDSLAAGYYATEHHQRYAEVLSKLMEEKLGYDVQLKPGAVKGGTGLKDMAIPNLAKVVSEKPDLITIEFGTNDLKQQKKKAYSNPADFKKRLEYVIEYLNTHLSNKPKIILVTTWARKESFTYDKIIEEVGKDKNLPVVNIQSVWQNRTDTRGPKGVQTYKGVSDNWHPNNKGHQEIAKAIFEKASAILK